MYAYMLDVTMTRCNDVCYTEPRNPPIHTEIKKKQRKFLRSVWRERSQLDDQAIDTGPENSLGARYNTKNYIQDLIHNDVDDVEFGMRNLMHKMRHATSSRRTTYLEIKLSLRTHPIYLKQQNVPERDCVTFKRFRVSSHSLGGVGVDVAACHCKSKCVCV